MVETRVMQRCASLLAFVVFLASCEEKKPPPSPDPATPSASAPPSASAIASAAPTSSVAAETIAAQHVLVAWKGAKGAPKAVTRSKADAKKRADEVAAKAKSGSDFSALVAEYTDDEG